MDQDYLRDLFAGIGPISLRRMFGGYGIYQDGTIFAVVLRDQLLLKGDAEVADEYEAAGMVRWQYVGKRHGKPVAMPYWTAPESALDDPDEMTDLARKALSAARRSAS
ncbi:MAG TPA: TfoX/Sxy family protein [Rhizobiaceae bacterium]|nr:TfoX/Sxy family protein [Rhizobiaceae bacterium]